MAGAVVALFAGLLLGAGLTVSQMVNPAKVLAFLDFAAAPAGGWDPSLALVMAGALLVALAGYRAASRREQPICATTFSLPTRRDIDWRLLAGAALFGIGWGLVGYCPGPAIAGVTLGSGKAAIFVASMLAGMAVYHFLTEKRSARDVRSQSSELTERGAKSIGEMSGH
jgi:uncharacterized membrane protein YedE/YeeE